MIFVEDVGVLECRNCPYGKDEFNRRMSFYGYELRPEEIPYEVEKHLWCEKTGGKISWTGVCEEPPLQYKQHSQRKRKRNKRERDLLYQNHLKLLAENYHGCYYCDKIYIKGKGFVENPKPYYKRFYRRRVSKCLKKVSNRKIRRYEGEISNGNCCHKIYDFWWELD